MGSASLSADGHIGRFSFLCRFFRVVPDRGATNVPPFRLCLRDLGETKIIINK